jgi:hypothetical protein
MSIARKGADLFLFQVMLLLRQRDGQGSRKRR